MRMLKSRVCWRARRTSWRSNNIDDFIEKNRRGGQGMGESMCNKLKYAVSFKVLPEYEAFLKDPSVIAVKDMSRVRNWNKNSVQIL